MTLFRYVLPLTILLLALVNAPMLAPSAHADGGSESRSILVFYSSAEGLSEGQNIFRAGFQMAANYLGYLVEYRDAARRPLPDEEAMEAYASVATTFYSGEMPNPDAFNTWLLEQSKAGKRLIILGSLAKAATGQPEENQDIVDAVLARLGIKQGTSFTRVRSFLRYTKLDKELANYERPLPDPPTSYTEWVADPGTTRTIIGVERTDKQAKPGAMVSVGPGGALAALEYLFWEDQVTYRQQWYVNPFKFLGLALGLEKTLPFRHSFPP